MSHSLIAADRRAHTRIVGVAVAFALVFVVVGLAVRMGDAGGGLVAANSPTVLKAETTSAWSHRETTGSVR